MERARSEIRLKLSSDMHFVFFAIVHLYPGQYGEPFPLMDEIVFVNTCTIAENGIRTLF